MRIKINKVSTSNVVNLNPLLGKDEKKAYTKYKSDLVKLSVEFKANALQELKEVRGAAWYNQFKLAYKIAGNPNHAKALAIMRSVINMSQNSANAYLLLTPGLAAIVAKQATFRSLQKISNNKFIDPATIMFDVYKTHGAKLSRVAERMAVQVEYAKALNNTLKRSSHFTAFYRRYMK